MVRFGVKQAGMAGAALALMVAGCAASHTATEARPVPVSVAAEPAAPAFSDAGIAALEARMAAYVAEGSVKGIDTLLVKDGEVISRVQAGIRREADGAPIAEDTVYRIYSMSKPITGVALLMLWEEGKFDLDDPVTKFIPEFEGLQVLKGLDEAGEPILEPINRPPTMQELMSHTAGFGYGLRGGDFVNDNFQTQQVLTAPDLPAMIERVAGIPLLYQPGETWSYSIAVDIQGYLVEKLSGQSFGAFLKARLFDPLGMTDTAFFVPEAEYDRFSDVWGWSEAAGGYVPLPGPGFEFRETTVAFEAGGHGLVSTMDDYARFAAMLVNGGSLDGAEILKPETIALMATDVLPEGVYIGHDGVAGTAPAGGGFGLNVGVVTDTEASGLGYMWGGAAGTWFWVDPANRVYFIGMVQRFGGGGPAFNGRAESARLVYEALQEAE